MGPAVGSEKYDYKLNWLEAIQIMACGSSIPAIDPLLICGDFNIAPEGRDTWDPKRWEGKILCSEPERAHFQALLELGFVRCPADPQPGTGCLYTWWDYRMGGFRRNWGLRIDHFLVTAPVVKRTKAVQVDKDERGGEKPSDHAPVTLQLE